MNRAVVLGALLATATLGWAERADACGGFFCSRVPIDQSGEKIVFAVKDGEIEVHVQIQYTGDAKQFSWVVPLHAKPELSVGSPQLFTYLDQVTSPRFVLTREPNNRCGDNRAVFGAEPPQASEAGGSVTVVSQEEVGPYDAAILQATDAKALTTWLKDNSYDLTPAGETALQSYVGPDYYFVALKLQQDKGVGDLRPIVLKMTGVPPCIPIKLTAIAARPNMPIIGYVFANNRAVPQNYRHVLINETKIDWLNGGGNYRQVASEAIDEAGGKAFLTELAQPVSTVTANQGFGRFVRYDTAKLAVLSHPVDFANELLSQGFASDPSLLSMFRKYIPMPASLKGQVSEQQFYNSLAQYRSQIDSDPGRAPFDAEGFANELEKTVVAPLKNAVKLFDYAYLTRLFTTMSPEEMTVDPEFQFNEDLGDVSNVHRAKSEMIDACNLDFRQQRYRITLEDGRSFLQSFGSGPLSEGPSAQRVESLETSGPPVVLKDNSPLINRIILNAGGVVPGSSCNCNAVDAPALLSALFGALALAARRKRS